MSIIFKTLQKLKSQAAQKAKRRAKIMRAPKNTSFKKVFSAPGVILLLFLVCFGIGIGTLYGYRYLHATAVKKPPKYMINGADIPVPANKPPVEIVKAPDLQNISLPNHTGLNRTTFLPPGSGIKGGADFSVQQPVEDQARSSLRKETSPAVAPSIQKEQPLSTVSAGSSSESNSAVKPKNDKTDKSLTAQFSVIPEEEKLFRTNLEKNSKNARLIAELQWEMGQNNVERTEQLFAELTRLKGANDSFVLKLKAFWHIREQEYGLAKDLLKEVLISNEIDLNAGINMAVIEIKTSQTQKAYQRLVKLQNIYPENNRIAELIQNLNL
jgi:hypothetical protein